MSEELQVAIAMVLLSLVMGMGGWLVGSTEGDRKAEEEFRRGWLAGIDYERGRKDPK